MQRGQRTIKGLALSTSVGLPTSTPTCTAGTGQRRECVHTSPSPACTPAHESTPHPTLDSSLGESAGPGPAMQSLALPRTVPAVSAAAIFTGMVVCAASWCMALA